jgi:hypothetical protein
VAVVDLMTMVQTPRVLVPEALLQSHTKKKKYIQNQKAHRKVGFFIGGTVDMPCAEHHLREHYQTHN